MSLDETKREGDIVVESNGVKVVLMKQCAANEKMRSNHEKARLKAKTLVRDDKPHATYRRDFLSVRFFRAKPQKKRFFIYA